MAPVGASRHEAEILARFMPRGALLALMATVTDMLLMWREGDRQAGDRLVAMVYEDMKQVAGALLRNERAGHTLNTTGLVHEAYVKLVDVDRVEWTDRCHFLAVASRAMRRILIDHARARSALKRGGGGTPPEALAAAGVDDDPARLLMLDDALERLARSHPRQSKALELVYFGGLSQEEVATALEISQPTVSRDLRFARAWLAKEWAHG